MTSLAAVTGATGMVGSRIVSQLLASGHRVKILTRNKNLIDSRLEIIHGGLDDPSVINCLLKDVDYLFHCAAEISDELQMWNTNVLGTKLLIESAKTANLKYICHLSSVGVIGKISGNFANEDTKCSPINNYEKTKYESEKLVMSFNGDAKVVILRPTNVVDKNKNAFLALNRLKLFIKGGENAHIVHAEDVAAAALYFMSFPLKISPDCFIVSYDEEKQNTIAGCIAACCAINNKTRFKSIRIRHHLSWRIPYLIRRILNGPCNRGDIIYSSKKLLSTGFKFRYGFIGAIKDICENS